VRPYFGHVFGGTTVVDLDVVLAWRILPFDVTVQVPPADRAIPADEDEDASEPETRKEKRYAVEALLPGGPSFVRMEVYSTESEAEGGFMRAVRLWDPEPVEEEPTEQEPTPVAREVPWPLRFVNDLFVR
jgi:hypothetical protein